MTRPVLCYITDRKQFRGDEASRRSRLLEKIAEAANAGVPYIQLREKDLPTRELESLARDVVRLIHDAKLRAGVLINSRTDIALAVGADGVQLRSDDISPEDVRRCNLPTHITIGVSCHTTDQVQRAAAGHADFALFAPVFEKQAIPRARPAGLDALREACQHPIPVLGLGGITLENAAACLAAGAAGVAAIRLFQENDITDVVESLRSL
jgi:thiamine-phosphate pyrophosphorylase